MKAGCGRREGKGGAREGRERGVREKGGKGKGKAVCVCVWAVLGREEEGGIGGINDFVTGSMSIGLAERDWVRLGGSLVCGCGMRDAGWGSAFWTMGLVLGSLVIGEGEGEEEGGVERLLSLLPS